METRIQHRRLILPLGFALACLVIAMLTLRSFGGSLPLEPRGYRVDVPLAEATNLVERSDVQIAGIDVGSVVAVRRTGNRAVAELDLEPEYAPLRSGARAILRTKTLLGEAYLEIAPGPAAAEAIPDGGRLARGQVRTTVQLDEMLETFSPQARQRLRDLFAGLSRALDGREAPLNRSLARAAPLTADLATVIDVLESQRAELQQLFAGSASVLDALGERQGELQAAITAGNDVLEATSRRDDELAATVRELGPFLTELRAASRTVTAAGGDLNRAIAGVRPVAPLVRPALAEISAAAPEFEGLFRELPAVIAAGNRGLPSLTRMLRAMGPAFAQLYPASRELIPQAELLGTIRNATYGTLANLGSSTNGTMVGPDGKIVHRAGGATSFWNESLGGWVKKLPTNRQNPYPRPNGLLDLGELGFIKSYDCRHTGNPLYLPPTGSGAPPCLTQGPWEFNGRSRYYPRLELAPP